MATTTVTLTQTSRPAKKSASSPKDATPDTPEVIAKKQATAEMLARIKATISNLSFKKKKAEIVELVINHEQQKAHDKALELYERRPFVVNTSETGAGKTIMALKLAQTYDMPIVLVVKNYLSKVKWEREAEKYGVKIISNLTYGKLTSTGEHQPKHGLLNMTIHLTDSGRKKKNYEPSAKLFEIIKEGALFVFDECSRLKNKNLSHKAVYCIFNALMSTDSSSRGYFMSAMPNDKPELTINLVQMVKIVTEPKLITRRNGEVNYEDHGLGEMIRYCAEIDAEKTQACREESVISTAVGAKLLVHQLYCKVLKHELCVQAKKVIDNEEEVKMLTNNMFVTLSAERKEELDGYVNQIAEIMNYTPGADEINTGSTKMGDVRKIEKHLENTKVDAFVQQAVKVLEGEGNYKVALYFNHYLAIDNAFDQLTALGYNPLRLTGKKWKVVKGEQKRVKVGDEETLQIVDAFNSDPNRRVLIANSRKGGDCIDLHDTVGDTPRVLFISATNSTEKMTQVAGRFYRVGVKSQAKVYALYVNESETEKAMYSLLNRKSAAAGEMLLDDGEGIALPSHYGDVDEDGNELEDDDEEE